MRVFNHLKLKCLVCGFIYNPAIIYGFIQCRLMSSYYVPNIVLGTGDNGGQPGSYKKTRQKEKKVSEV